MFSKLTSRIFAVSVFAMLTACSGDSTTEFQPGPASAAAPALASVPASSAPRTGIDTAAASVRLSGHIPAVLQPEVQVSESERVAEELRLVDYEQKFSIEMNRRAQEQSEREQRAGVSARAGVVQGPGCEGTEGHAALECERSII